MADFVRNDNLIIDKGSIDTGKTVVTPITRSEDGVGIDGFIPNGGTPGLNLIGGGNGFGSGNGQNINTTDSDGADTTPGNGGNSGNFINHNWDTDMSQFVWSPDPNATPEDNLKSLYSWLNNMLYTYQFTSFNYQMPREFNYGQLLSVVYANLSDLGPLKDLSDSATVELAEKIADMSFSYINSQFQSALSYQSWYLQQEYNSPVNQVDRLAAAGLNSAFALGSLNSGNASSPAAMPHDTLPQASNAGQAQAQEDSSSMGLLGSILGTAASFIPAVGGAVSGLINAFCTKKMTPLQIAKAGTDIVTGAANLEQMQTVIEGMKNSQVLDQYNSFLKGIQTESDIAQSNVSSSRDAFYQVWNSDLYTSELTELKYQTTVKDKSGNLIKKEYSEEETEQIIQNGGKDVNGNVVVGSENWSNVLSAEVEGGYKSSANFGIPGIGKGSAGWHVNGRLGDSYTKGGSKSDSTSSVNEANYSHTGSSKSKSYGYSEDGTSFHIGDSEFKSVTSRRRVPLKEHAAFVKSQFERYQAAVDRFNALTEGQISRINAFEDNLIKNFGQLNMNHQFGLFKETLRSLIIDRPKTMIAD